MAEPSQSGSSGRSEGLVPFAALVVIVFGLQAARSWLVPVCFALLLAVLTSLPVGWLMRRRLPRPVAVLVSIAGVAAVLWLLGLAFTFGVQDFGERWPVVQANLELQLQEVVDWLATLGIELEMQQLVGSIEPRAWLRFLQQSLGGAIGLLSSTFLVAITAFFAAWEGKRLHDRLEQTFGQHWKESRALRLAADLQAYTGVKFATSLLTGVLVYVLTLAIGVEGQLLWGLLAFVLNFVPIVGSILAAVPPLLLTLSSPELGAASALVMAIAFVAINSGVGNVIEPVLLGRQFGMPAFVVMLSLVFWGWLWGAGGMFLAVPLTIVVGAVIAGRSDLSLLRALVGR